MKTDFTELRDPEAKQETRRMALDAVRESSLLWSAKSGLRYDWIELASERAPTLRFLLDVSALRGSARFIGVDLDEGVIQRCRGHYVAAPAEWHCARLETLLTPKGAFPSGGALVYDTEYSIGRKDLRSVLRPVLTYAARQHARLGEFFLALNLVDDSAARGRGRDSAAYARWLASELHLPRVEPHIYRSGRFAMVWVGIRYGY